MLDHDSMRRCLMLIHTKMSEPDWSPDTLAGVSEVLNHFGYTCDDFRGYDTADAYDTWQSYHDAIVGNQDNWKVNHESRPQC